MRPALHLISLVLVLPVLALALAFIALGRTIAAGSALNILDQLVRDAAWLIPWGALAACAVLMLIAVGGLFVRTRWLAGSCVAVLGIGTTAIVLALPAGKPSLAELPFLVPGLVGSGIGAWFAFTERPRRRVRYVA